MAAPRTVAIRRHSYEPEADQERFIVPLLKDRIEGALRGTPAQGRTSRVLDVGCGRQPFRRLLETLGYQYAGIDVNQSPDLTVDFVCAIDEELPRALRSQEFDLIICLEVLEHVANWDRAFKNLFALLAPGGSLLVTCPAFYPLHEEPYDFWRPTPFALAHFGAACGLVPRSIEMAGDTWDVFGTALTLAAPRPVKRGIGGRVASKSLAFAIRLAFRCIRAGWPQRLVDLDGPLYLSNIAWFDKPEVASSD